MLKQVRSSHLLRPVCLIGMMGAGKSSVGQELAKRLGIRFYDTDQVIESEQGHSIASLFSLIGEHGFRQLETKVVQRLVVPSARIISVGGGAFMNQESRDLLLQSTDVVWLRARKETLWSRLEGAEDRPLLKADNPQKKLEDMMVLRHPLYALAPKVVDCDEGSVAHVVDRVFEVLQQNDANSILTP